jgi:serine/threonine protein kinase
MRLAPGMKLDRYELVCPLAQGGMANIWIARQTEGIERLVAIKTVLPKFAADKRFHRMLVEEARIASQIKHAHVARTLGVLQRSGVTYLVMEYVDGESLSSIQRALKETGAAFPPGVLLRIMADVCDGLHAAHELRDPGGQFLGVVHRDVSPPNVLVDASGVAKLIDFGVVKARDRVGDDTTTGHIKGKVCYMAPEQADGQHLDRRADIWAVGAMMYHCLAGKPPYEAANDAMTLVAIGRGLPLDPLPRSVAPEIAAVVIRALQFSRSDRFVTAAWMKAAVEEAMVRTNLATSSAMVAGFLQAHVGHLRQKRRERIAAGLTAASGEVGPEVWRAWESLANASPASSSVPSTVVEPFRKPRRRYKRLGFALAGVAVGVGLCSAWLAIPMVRPKAGRAPLQARPAESSAREGGPSWSSAEAGVVRNPDEVASADAGADAVTTGVEGAGPRPPRHPLRKRPAGSGAAQPAPEKQMVPGKAQTSETH